MRTMLRPLQQLSMYCLNAGNAPHAGLRFRGMPIGIGLTRLVVLFSFLIGPVYFVHTIVSESDRFWIGFHRHYLLVLAITVFALVILRLGSLRIVLPTPAIVGNLVLRNRLLVFVILQACTIERNLNPDDYPVVE